MNIEVNNRSVSLGRQGEKMESALNVNNFKTPMPSNPCSPFN